MLMKAAARRGASLVICHRWAVRRNRIKDGVGVYTLGMTSGESLIRLVSGVLLHALANENTFGGEQNRRGVEGGHQTLP